MANAPFIYPLEQRRQMAGIWKRVFNDSDDYIDLFFNNYLSEKYTRFVVRDGKVVAALYGVPYTFRGYGDHCAWGGADVCGSSEPRPSVSHILHGLYLCGLATLPEYRGQGLMRQLIKEVEEVAKNDGFDFTFLIPADDGIVSFYEYAGYAKSMYRIINRYTSNHDFLRAAMSNSSFDKSRFDAMGFHELLQYDSALMHRIFNLFYNVERSGNYMSLNHSVCDIDVIIEECRVSKGRIFYTQDADNNVASFATVSVNDDGEVVIPHLFAMTQESAVTLLCGVRDKYPDSQIALYDYPENAHTAAIWRPYYEAGSITESENDFTSAHDEIYYSSSHPMLYGMAKILKADTLMSIAAELAPSQKSHFSITDLSEHFYLEDGICHKLERKCLQSSERKPADLWTELTSQQLAEILFRKWSADDIVGTAFGLPRIPLNMADMLD